MLMSVLMVLFPNNPNSIYPEVRSHAKFQVVVGSIPPFTKLGVDVTAFHCNARIQGLTGVDMLNITEHQGNANQNHNDILPHTCSND